MKARIASPNHEKDSAAAMWQAGPEPALTFTARQRLHQNIQRLQSLDQQLLAEQLQQPELLTAIELVGFKIRHLARQIQDAEQMGAGAAC